LEEKTPHKLPANQNNISKLKFCLSVPASEISKNQVKRPTLTSHNEWEDLLKTKI
jgi:hypothetical protein